ncbi:putative serine/arginine repetitive matrix protein 2 [Penaeus vannamei]|uniref:Putative serine/arginine repetitive matrix protein 2 n=1 Tax=Penaeus vannamei TaxID=6689 RepID=A0A423SMD6_PENVA|nr:putative serine/arginine repetitive matrix protein 2 [Penaeus vannamei]
MWKELVLLAGALAFAHAQQFDYYDYVDDAQTREDLLRPSLDLHPNTPPNSRPQTTQIPLRIDTKTGGFVYQYAGADGSAKYELRLPNGTVTGNYTFINDLGERETRWYSAGVHDPSLVDETTDPNYVDRGNYDLYKHLEEPYVHIAGTDGSFDAQAPRSSPRAQPPIFEGVPVEPLEPLPPVPAAPPPPPVRSGRGRAGGRVKVSSRPVSPPHRLNSQSATDAFLDDIISRFS